MQKHKLLGTNKDGSTPKRDRRSGILQPDHLGRPTPAKMDRNTVHHMSHGLGDAVRGHAHSDMARNGAPKHVHAVPIHGGMTERQHALAGMGHANATAPDANPASPLSKEPQGKAFVDRQVSVHPGSARNRAVVHDPGLTDAIFREAMAASNK